MSILTNSDNGQIKTGKNEKALFYGQKIMDMNLFQELAGGVQKCVLATLVKASRNLGKIQDEMRFVRENLKIDVKWYNDGNQTDQQLLFSYARLIESQLENKAYKNALKTYKHIKLSYLNSNDPRDVLASLREKGYEVI